MSAAPCKCPCCGDEDWNLVSTGKTGFDSSKATLGVHLFGIVGLAMGRGGKPKLTFRCSKCGFEHDYNEMPYEDSYYTSRVEPIDEEEYKRQNARNEMALSNGYISRDTYMRYKKIIQSSYQLYCEKYKKLSVEERDRRVEVQKNLRQKGVISQGEYEQSIRDLNRRCVDYVEPKQEKADNVESLTEDQKIEMLIKYKKLLDDGVLR